MIKKLIFTTVLLLFIGLQSFATAGEIFGKITEKDSDIPIEFVTISLQSSSGSYYLETDSSGYFTLNPMSAGTYTLQAHRVGYKPVKMEELVVRPNKATEVNFQMEMAEFLTTIPTILPAPRIAIIDNINITTGMEISAKEIELAPVSTVSEIVSTAPGVIQDDAGNIQVRGARTGTTLYLVEGMKVRNLNWISVNAVENMEVLTSGIPAKYGDATGGVVIISLK